MTTILDKIWTNHIEKPLNEFSNANFEFKHPRCARCSNKIEPCTKDTIPKGESERLFLNMYVMFKHTCCNKIICSECVDMFSNNCECCGTETSMKTNIGYASDELTRPLLNKFNSGKNVTSSS